VRAVGARDRPNERSSAQSLSATDAIYIDRLTVTRNASGSSKVIIVVKEAKIAAIVTETTRREGASCDRVCGGRDRGRTADEKRIAGGMSAGIHIK
jgi:hypothetical protein